MRDVEEQRPGRIGDVGRELAGEPQANVVLRQEHVRDPRVESGSCRRSQSSFGAVKPGSARLPVSSISRCEPDALLDLVALGAGALVVPEDRRPQDPSLRVEGDEAVHLPGEADPAPRRHRAGRGRLGGAPPVLGVLLGPAGLGVESA